MASSTTAEKAEEVEVKDKKETAGNPADDFFTPKNDANIGDWIKHMKSPREEIEELEVDYPEDEEPVADQLSAEEQEALKHLDYNEGQYKTAEFFLIQLDKILAFSFSLISGMESDRYRIRKKKPEGDDYEAEITAALIKKYQMELPLEGMLATALIMAYAPGFRKALTDRAQVKQAKAKQEAQQ